MQMISNFIWPEVKGNAILKFEWEGRLPQQENGSDCGLFMLEFMLRAFHDVRTLTNFLVDENRTGNFEPLFTSDLILKRRDQYRDLIMNVAEA